MKPVVVATTFKSKSKTKNLCFKTRFIITVLNYFKNQKQITLLITLNFIIV